MKIVRVIQHKNDASLFWKQGVGWVEEKDATEFDLKDEFRYPLPPQGQWRHYESTIQTAS